MTETTIEWLALALTSAAVAVALTWLNKQIRPAYRAPVSHHVVKKVTFYGMGVTAAGSLVALGLAAWEVLA